MDRNHCESFEEIFKRIQFNKINLEATSLNDESSVILFDMLEYYESAKQLNISYNPDIEVQGWQACANMIRKAECLEHLEAKGITLQEQYMNILSRTLRLVCHLHVLKLENCGLSGRSIAMLVAALKMNTGIRELYLADNGLNLYDAIQLGSLLRFNNHIQLLDISNNNIQDDGVRDILEGLINQINEDKDGKGLSILVLWNNQLTSKSSPYFARIIALSKTIETLNIGKNMLTNELLFIIKDALEKNPVLLQLGMQAIDLTCDGIVTLSKIIEINQVLQRIDLRNNNIQLTGMRALSSAMKKNRSISKIDLDDKPTLNVDDLTEALHQYTQLVAEIQVCCSENEQNRIIEENSKGSESSHHSSLCSTNSRKISLTCLTLPRCLPTIISIQNDKSGQSMLEPKRINGGRLRSPALSPKSSPITSPISSPSRNRFVVSRVPETSTCSTDSLASSSPSVAPSLQSSSTYLTSSASGSSRFRVSPVESANITPLPKPDVPVSSKIDVTAGLDFKVNISESTDSDASGNICRLKFGMNNYQDVEIFHMSNNVPYLISNVIEERPPAGGFNDVGELSSDRRSTETIKTQFSDSINSTTLENKEYCDVQYNQVNIPTRLESITSLKHVENVENNCIQDTKNIKTFLNVNRGDKRSNCTIRSDKSITNFIDGNKKHDVKRNLINILLNERIGLQYQTGNNYIQEHCSNLEKIFALFQHPDLRSRCTLQDNVSIGMPRENKFHYYLQENRDRIRNHGTLAYSTALKNKPTKSFAIFQLLSAKSLANMSLSFKYTATLNVAGQSSELYPKTVTEVSFLLKPNRNKDLINIKNKCTDHSNENKQFQVDVKRKIDPLGHQLLVQDIQSKNYIRLINKHLVLMANGTVPNMIVSSSCKLINNILLIHVLEREMPLFKFLNIHEYFTLKVAKNYMKHKNIEEIINNIDFILVKTTCDKTLTNSINFTSDSSPLFCGAMYDIICVNHMHNVNTFDRLHNVLLLNLNMNDDVQNNFVLNADNKQNNLVHVAYKEECDCNIITSRINNKITRIYNTDNNNAINTLTNICNMWRTEIGRIYIHSDLHDLLSLNSMGWRNTILNNMSEVGTSKMKFKHKNINLERSDDSTNLCYVLQSFIRKALQIYHEYKK